MWVWDGANDYFDVDTGSTQNIQLYTPNMSLIQTREDAVHLMQMYAHVHIMIHVHVYRHYVSLHSEEGEYPTPMCHHVNVLQMIKTPEQVDKPTTPFTCHVCLHPQVPLPTSL